MSRKITYEIVGAFNYKQKAKKANTESTGSALYLHGNRIAEWREDGLWITNAGWSSNTTKERLNGLRGVSIYQKNYQWYLNGKEWNGNWVNVSRWDANDPTAQTMDISRDDRGRSLNTVAMVAALGDIFHAGDKKASNDWKARMLKAGIPEGALHMPEDWESLSEDEKERRLNGAIDQLKD